MLKTSHQTQDKASLTDDADELYRYRWVLAVCLAVAVLLLAIWGYIVTPRSGPFFLIWCVMAALGIAILSLTFTRSVRLVAKKVLLPTSSQPHFSFQNLPLALPLLMLAGFVFYLTIIFVNPQPLRNDAFYYSDQAYALLKNGYVPNIVRPPGYALFLAAIYKLVRGPEPTYDYASGPPAFFANEVAVWIAQAGLLTLTVGLVYLIVNEAQALGHAPPTRWRSSKFYWGQPLPLLAAALTAFCPFTAAFGGVLLTEIAALFWLTLTVLFWLKALRYPRVPLYFALLGGSLAWLMETRPTFIYLPLLVLATLIWFAPGRWKIIGPGVLLVALALFLGPQSAANSQYNHSLNPVIVGDLAIFNQVEGIFWETNGGLRYQRLASDVKLDSQTADALRHFSDVLSSDKLTEQQTQTTYWHSYFDNYLKNNPVQFAATAAKRWWYQWDQHYVYAFYDPVYFDYRWLTDNLNRLYLIFGLVGLVLIGRLWGRGAWPLWLSLSYLTLVNAVVRTEFRYSLPAYPLLLIVVAVGLGAVLNQLRGTKTKISRRVWAGLVGASLLVVFLSAALPVIPNTTTNHEKALNSLDQASDYQRSQVHNLSAARTAYNTAIELDPLEPQVYLERGQFLQNQTPSCDKVQARADFEKYLQLAPAESANRADIKKYLQNLPQFVSGCGQ